jgi:DNA repair protein RadC
MARWTSTGQSHITSRKNGSSRHRATSIFNRPRPVGLSNDRAAVLVDLQTPCAARGNVANDHSGDDVALLAAALPGEIDATRHFQAKELLETFGSIRAVLAAPREALLSVTSCTQSVVERLHISEKLLRRSMANSLTPITDVGWADIAKRLYFDMAHLAREEIRALYFSHTEQLITECVIAVGSHSECTFSMQSLVLPALLRRSPKLVLVHNHPSGYSKASLGDIRSTTHIVSTCKGLGLRLLDHLVVAEDGVYSIFGQRIIYESASE